MRGITGKIYHDRERSVAESDLYAIAYCLMHQESNGGGILFNDCRLIISESR